MLVIDINIFIGIKFKIYISMYTLYIIYSMYNIYSLFIILYLNIFIFRSLGYMGKLVLGRVSQRLCNETEAKSVYVCVFLYLREN